MDGCDGTAIDNRDWLHSMQKFHEPTDYKFVLSEFAVILVMLIQHD